MSHPPPSPLQAAAETGILGSPEFIRQCQEWLTPAATPQYTLPDIITAVCAEFTASPDSMSVRGRHDHAPRDAAVLIARELLSVPLETLAARFGGVSRSAISEIAKRARQRVESDAGFHRHVEAVRVGGVSRSAVTEIAKRTRPHAESDARPQNARRKNLPRRGVAAGPACQDDTTVIVAIYKSSTLPNPASQSRIDSAQK